MTSEEINRAVILAGGNLDDTPVFRLGGNKPPTRKIRLAAGVGDIALVYYADVHSAREAPEERIRLNEEQNRRVLFTYWQLDSTLPELLPGALIVGLRIGQEVELPVNGIMLSFQVSEAET